MIVQEAKRQRKSIRLKDYDLPREMIKHNYSSKYSGIILSHGVNSQAGAYFVTSCVKEGECLFGQIVDENMILNEYGKIVLSCWNDLPSHYSHIRLDAFQIMPNHTHGIIFIVGAGLKPAPTPGPTTKRHGLPEIVRAFKTFSARRINESRRTPGEPIWQRNYFERVIRDEDELHPVR